MKNEENRGLNDKKVYEDQFMAFVSSLMALSLLFSHTLWHLEYSWSTLAYIGFGERGQRKARKCKGKVGSTTTTRFLCRYRVARIISFLVLACMAHACGFLVMIFHWHGGLPRLTLVLPSLAISWIAMVLWVYLLFFLDGVHVPYGYGLSY